MSANCDLWLLTAVRAGALVWGGDWNQSLTGPDWAGSSAGRRNVADTLSALELQSPVAGHSHQLTGHSTIDHVAVGYGVPVTLVGRSSTDGRSASRHQARKRRTPSP